MSWEKRKLGEVCSLTRGEIGINKAIPSEHSLVETSEEQEYNVEYHSAAEAVVSALKQKPSINNLPHLKTFRKNIRNNPTPAEARLWMQLKGKQLEGRKFRRQFSVANYILDFYCHSEHLAIELDGQGHFEARQAEYDRERDLFLNHCGIKVLRFENRWVWNDPEGLLDEVKRSFGWEEKNNLAARRTAELLENKNPSVLWTAPLEGEQLERDGAGFE